MRGSYTMKTIVLITMALLLSIPGVLAQTGWTTEVQPICQNDVCVEGSNAIWRMRITNVGDELLRFGQIAMSDDLNFVFASRAFQEPMVVEVGQAQIVDLQGVIPAPTKGSLAYYTISYAANGQVFTDNVRAASVLPLSEVECLTHDYCGAREVCLSYRCVPENLVNMTNISRMSDDPEGFDVGFADVMLVVIAVLLGILVAQLSRK